MGQEKQLSGVARFMGVVRAMTLIGITKKVSSNSAGCFPLGAFPLGVHHYMFNEVFDGFESFYVACEKKRNGPH